jgi:hypothetical protein
VRVHVCVCACVCLSAAQQTNDSENGSEPAGTNYSIGHVGLHAMPFNGDLVNHHFGNRIRFNSLTLREIFNLQVFLNLKCLPCGKKRSETVRNGQKRTATWHSLRCSVQNLRSAFCFVSFFGCVLSDRKRRHRVAGRACRPAIAIQGPACGAAGSAGGHEPAPACALGGRSAGLRTALNRVEQLMMRHHDGVMKRRDETA